METRKMVLGPEQPDTLTSMSNLSFTLRDLAEGGDSPATTMVKRLIERPTEHLSCGILGNSSDSVASPTRKDGGSLKIGCGCKASDKSIFRQNDVAISCNLDQSLIFRCLMFMIRAVTLCNVVSFFPVR